MLVGLQNVGHILRCPVCRSLIEIDEQPRCSQRTCANNAGFQMTGGQPVLIDFAQSIFPRDLYASGSGSAAIRSTEASAIGKWLEQFTYGKDSKSAAVANRFFNLCGQQQSTFRVLVIGGGTVGDGMEEFYSSARAELVGTDVYASDQTVLVCDAHNLPFLDGSFDAVIIQAVLEHVLDPTKVAEEIHRVLKADGLVLADSPFMQQVHEGAYDFFRFSVTAHRWLFRCFAEVDAGVAAGPATALLWSIRYYLRSIGLGPRATTLVTALFSWARLFGSGKQSRAASDAASALYFIGRKSPTALDARELPAYYDRWPESR